MMIVLFISFSLFFLLSASSPLTYCFPLYFLLLFFYWFRLYLLLFIVFPLSFLILLFYLYCFFFTLCARSYLSYSSFFFLTTTCLTLITMLLKSRSTATKIHSLRNNITSCTFPGPIYGNLHLVFQHQFP